MESGTTTTKVRECSMSTHLSQYIHWSKFAMGHLCNLMSEHISTQWDLCLQSAGSAHTFAGHKFTSQQQQQPWPHYAVLVCSILLQIHTCFSQGPLLCMPLVLVQTTCNLACITWSDRVELKVRKKKAGRRKKELSEVTKVLKHRLLLNHNVTISIHFLQM